MANKKVNPKNEQFDFSDSVKAIREAAKTVNSQVREMTAEIVEDLKENGEQLRDRATAPVKEAYDKAYNRVTETVNREKIAKAAKDVNEYALKTATEVVDGAIENSEKWQGVATKAVKGGLKLAAKQQDIVFNTLETVKGQLSESASRIKKLFSNN